MSGRFETGHDNLLIPLRWSPGITGLHLLVWAGALIAIILDQWFNLWLKAFLSLAVTLSVADSLYRHGLRLHPDTVQALSLSSGQWRVRQRNGEWQEAEVLPGATQGTGLSWLEYVSPLPPACWSFPETASGMISSVGVT